VLIRKCLLALLSKTGTNRGNGVETPRRTGFPAMRREPCNCKPSYQTTSGRSGDLTDSRPGWRVMAVRNSSHHEAADRPVHAGHHHTGWLFSAAVSCLGSNRSHSRLPRYCLRGPYSLRLHGHRCQGSGLPSGCWPSRSCTLASAPGHSPA
jgi:hypothetical protein